MTDGSKKTLVLNGKAFYLIVKEGWIYYSDDFRADEGNKIYKIRIDGTHNTLVCDDNVAVLMGVAGNWIYYYDRDTNLCKVKTDGTMQEEINTITHTDTSNQQTSETTDGKQEEVTVSNVHELYSSLGSNKHIKLNPGVYNLSQLVNDTIDSEIIHKIEVYDGISFQLQNIKNMTLEGLGSEPVQIVVEPRYAQVLSFDNCSNITLKNIKAGHTIAPGYCTGGVLFASNSTDFSISNCNFYGCGTYGIEIYSSKRFKIDNSIIEDCTYGIMRIGGAEDVSFTNSKFHDCAEFDMINIKSSNVNFDNCEISDNQTKSSFFYFLDMDNEGQVTFNNCIFKNNKALNFIKNGSKTVFQNTIFQDNSFTSPSNP